jgi:tetratricopeptide (TPR) repeat protein
MARSNGSLSLHIARILDNLGKEKEAVQHYESATAKGLSAREMPSAMLGLGSTYRFLKRHDDSVRILEQAAKKFPNNRAIKVFLAYSYCVSGETEKALSIFLKIIADTSSDYVIHKYKRALEYYSKNP